MTTKEDKIQQLIDKMSNTAHQSHQYKLEFNRTEDAFGEITEVFTFNFKYRAPSEIFGDLK